MANISGTNIAAIIAPFTTEDSYATHDSKYGKGGWHEVSSIEERDAIPIERRTLGMAVYNTTSGILYILQGNNVSENNWKIFDNQSTTFVFSQSIANNIWNINHNLNKYPSVTVIDSAGTEVIGDIKYTDSNNIIITFSNQFTGKAYLN